MELLTGYIEVHIFRRSGDGLEFLMLKRNEKEKVYPGLWQMVTGKVREGERAYESALREIKEETGIKPLKLWVAPKVNQFYSAETDAVYSVPVFAAEAGVSDQVTLCYEHCEFKWLNYSDARNLLPWEEQRKAMDIITGYIQKMADYLNLVEIAL